MKKLILSLMIVLGTVLGAQAQTFDFSCSEPISTDVSAFTAAERTLLTSNEFSSDVSEGDNPSYFQIVDDVRGNIVITKLNDATDGVLFEISDDVSVDTVRFSSLDDAIASALAVPESNFVFADFAIGVQSADNSTSDFNASTGVLTIQNSQPLVGNLSGSDVYEWESFDNQFGDGYIYVIYERDPEGGFSIDANESPVDAHGDVIESESFPTAQGLINRLGLPGDFSWVEIKELLDAGFDEESRNRFQVHGGSLDIDFVVSIINNRFNVIDGDGEYETNVDTIEEVIEFARYAGANIPQGFSGAQNENLVNDGIVYTTITTNGCASCPTKMRFQGEFINSNGDVQNFILSIAPEGATHEEYDADSNLIDGSVPHNYSITGHNFTSEYFLNLDVAIARAVALNTRN